jgi:hypothetical protein
MGSCYRASLLSRVSTAVSKKVSKRDELRDAARGRGEDGLNVSEVGRREGGHDLKKVVRWVPCRFISAGKGGSDRSVCQMFDRETQGILESLDASVGV